MIIILKPTMKAMKNIFILMVSGQKLILEKQSIYLLGYIIEELKQMLQCTRSASTQIYFMLWHDSLRHLESIMM